MSGIKLTVFYIFVSVSLPSLVTSVDDSMRCETVVSSWAKSAINVNRREDTSSLRDLLFFLHIPRTGGRTYYHCFLRNLYPSNRECPRSYDRLRFDPSKTKCKLLVTHDDYGLLSKLLEERTSVITVLRNPTDRVLSTYEFAVEVAARFLVHPNLTSATQMSSRVRRKSHGVSTLDIWPWKYLVPWMREDLFARRDARKRRKGLIIETTDPYNMETVVMPLEKFIAHPMTNDIVHNGATFQVAGLTNNSWLAQAHEVRHCVNKYPELGHYVLDIAKRRLDNMQYIGLTEDHRESATLFANMVGAQVLSKLNLNVMVQNSTKASDVPNSRYSESSHQNISNQAKTESPSEEDPQAVNGTMTVKKLAETYESCTSKLRKLQVGRHAMSLKHISPANFSKEARSRVPKALLQQISSRNYLDIELYKHAQLIFLKQHGYLKDNIETVDSELEVEPLILDSVKQMDKQSSYHKISVWKLPLATLAVVCVFIIYMVVIARRRTLKLKM